ncbi:hypothetical protein VTH82DRAFT_6390 [Thermothelomyces myriococcoides]
MKFTVATVLALAAVALAYPAGDKGARVKRQEGGQPDVSVPSMTDAEGNVVPFDSSGVFKAASEGN